MRKSLILLLFVSAMLIITGCPNSKDPDYSNLVIPEPEEGYIVYTTTDGKPVKFITSAQYSVVSNTYEDGIGRIVLSDMKSINNNLFYGCKNLYAIALPSGVTSIGYNVFAGGCSSLASINIPSSVTSIGYGAFAGTAIKSMDIPSGVTKIEKWLFSGCSSLKSVTIPSGVTKIEREVFDSCSSLQSIDLPSGLKEISYYLFCKCKSLKSIKIPSGVTLINSGAFDSCASLTSVEIPSGVTMIGGAAFKNCTSLKSIYCSRTTPPSGASEMFDNNASGRKIYVPRASVDEYKNDRYWSTYAADIVGYDF